MLMLKRLGKFTLSMHTRSGMGGRYTMFFDTRLVQLFMPGLVGSIVVVGFCPFPVRAGITTRVSVKSTGAEVDNQNYHPSTLSMRKEGRFVVFASAARNLVAGDTNDSTDIFVHDRDADGNGVFDEPNGITTARVSVASAGDQADARSLDFSLSADGNAIAFTSEARNLVAGDTNGTWDAFVHDRLGVVQKLCGGFAVTILGTDGPDILIGTAGPDVIHGLEGQDMLYGRGGNDILCGGPGDDVLYGGSGNDWLYGNRGRDYLYGGSGSDICIHAQPLWSYRFVNCETVMNVP
jgi:Ca2+-binding RTX toxin-like protein